MSVISLAGVLEIEALAQCKDQSSDWKHIVGHSVTKDIKKESKQCQVAKLIIPRIIALSVTIFNVYLGLNLQYETSLVQSLTNCRTYSCFVLLNKIFLFDHTQRKIIF